MKTLLLSFVAIIFALSSCNKDDKDDNQPGSSRTIRYELTGNFSGLLIASYTTAAGSTANETVSSLPWNKEITYASNVTAAIIAVSGNGGSIGQQVTVVVKRGGNRVSSTVITANNSGSFSQAAPVVTF